MRQKEGGRKRNRIKALKGVWKFTGFRDRRQERVKEGGSTEGVGTERQLGGVKG